MLFFMKPVLENISRGVIFKRVFSILLWVLAVAFVIGGITTSILLWSNLRIYGLGGGIVLGSIIAQIFLIILVYMIVHTIIIRAKEILSQPEGKFTVIPIASIFCKLVGELFASFMVVFSIALSLSLWITGSAFMIPEVLQKFIPHGDVTFVIGLLTLIFGALYAFFVLMFFYFLSESIILVVDIAQNLKIVRDISERNIH
jgi:hypothetical protein